MKKFLKVCLCIIAGVVVLCAGFLGVNDLRGAAPSFNAFLIDRRMDRALEAIAAGDAAQACKQLGYDENPAAAPLFRERLLKLKEVGFEIMSGESDILSLSKQGGAWIGTGVIIVKTADTHFWQGNGEIGWEPVAMDNNRYALEFQYHVSSGIITILGASGGYSYFEPDEPFTDIPEPLQTVMMYLASGNHNDVAAQNVFEIEQDMPETFVGIAKRVEEGFAAVAAGDYNRACEYFGAFSTTAKDCFAHGMSFYEHTQLDILSAQVLEQSMRTENGETVLDVMLRVYQGETADTFGYVATWPTGEYTMVFQMKLVDDILVMVDVSEIYLPGKTINDLTIYYVPDFGNVYDTQAPFMHELFLILQSYDLNSGYAEFWGYA